MSELLRSPRAIVALGLTVVAWAVVMCALEPVLLDGWFVADFSGDWLEFARANRAGELFWGNARLGQIASAFTYTPAIHVVVTPLFVLALFALMTAHVRGRLVADARLGLVIVALTILAQPQLGPVLFYRPYAANYLFGLVVQLAWMLPYRIAIRRDARAIERGGAPRTLAVAGMLVLGVAAGACNEHTGPALAVAAAVVAVRAGRARRLRIWMLAGLAGFVAGYLALMLAPAQSTRYCGVAELSVASRIAERGVLGNLATAFAIVWAGRWMWLAGIVVGAAAWRRTRVTGADERSGDRAVSSDRDDAASGDREDAARATAGVRSGDPAIREATGSVDREPVDANVGGRELARERDPRSSPTRVLLAWVALALAISATLIASPKQGERLLFAPLVFATIGVAGVVDAVTGRARTIVTSFAGVIVAAAIAWSIALYARVHADAGDRLDRLAAATPRGAILQLPMLRDGDSRWFLGDDLRSDRHRAYVAERFGLEDIELAGHPTIPFHYELRDGATRRIGPLAQLCEARHELAAHPDGELAIVSSRRMLDGRPLLAARWRDGRLVAPTATVVHEGGMRWIAIERGGLVGPLEVILVGPGREQHLEPSGERWSYTPWGPGSYWIVACAGDCYVTEMVRHTQV